MKIKTIKYATRGQKHFKETQDTRFNAMVENLKYSNQGQIFKRNIMWQNLCNKTI